MINIHGSVMVVGDLMLDVYINGEVSRVSPEAPVLIVAVTNRINTLGGAGNVALNLANLGCQTYLFGRRGDDVAGNSLLQILHSKHIEHGLYLDQVLPTTTKTRVMAGHQQLIRFDDEATNGTGGCQAFLKTAIDEIISSMNAIVLSDYGKGVLTHDLMKWIINRAGDMKIPVLVDPKSSDWSCYSGASVITPNISELEKAIGKICDKDDVILDAAQSLSNHFEIESIIVTRGSKGMLVVIGDKHEFIPTVAKSVFDVSGAGDTVIATMAACISSGYLVVESARIANAAAGVVVGKLGTSPIEINELQNNLRSTSNG